MTSELRSVRRSRRDTSKNAVNALKFRAAEVATIDEGMQQNIYTTPGKTIGLL